MKNHIKEAFIVVLVIILVVGITLLSWKAERAVNWKLSYGGKVDKKIEQLEDRIEQLENFHKKDLQSE